MAASRWAWSSSTPLRGQRSRPNWSNCCSDSRIILLSLSRISIVPTKRRRPRNRRIAWQGCLKRSAPPTQLFELVCEAAVLRGTFASATIALAEPDGEFLRIAASKGIDYERMRDRRFAISAAVPEGRGLTGTSFRTREPCIMNDFLRSERAVYWHALARQDGTRSGASFPLLKDGNKAIGVLLFLSLEEGVFTGDLVALLGRLAENVSFALDNFDRADEKARADEQKERLTRMYAALSATNEAIMRAKSRTELFELVCEAAVV